MMCIFFNLIFIYFFLTIDFWGWNFHKDVEVAKGTVIGGEQTGGLDAHMMLPLVCLQIKLRDGVSLQAVLI